MTKLSSLIWLLVVLFVASTVTACSWPFAFPATTKSEFYYPVEVQSETGDTVSDAEVTIQVGRLAPLNGITDVNGFVRIFVDSSYTGQPGVLIVEAKGFVRYRQEINLTEGILPDVVRLEPAASSPEPTEELPPEPTNEPTIELTEEATDEPTQEPTQSPDPGPTKESTREATQEPTPEPTIETPLPPPSPTFTGKLAIPLMLGFEFKVYITGFDGSGVNGTSPVSLGNARQPMFRRDGQAIMVNGTAGAFNGVFITDAQGLAPAIVNGRAEAYWPTWSPDGTEFIFSDTNFGRRIFRQSVSDPSNLQELQISGVTLTGDNLLWSDDGRIIFRGCAEWIGQANECGIWVTDASATSPQRIVVGADGFPTDAKLGLLTYMSNAGSDWEIYLVPLNGGQPVQLTDNASQDGLAAIAPDGRSVAYLSNEDTSNWALWTITLVSGQKQKWFDIDPQRGAIDLELWAQDRISWTR